MRKNGSRPRIATYFVLGVCMKNVDAVLDVKGEFRFTGDIPAPEGVLHGAVFSSPAARGKIIRLDCDAARGIEGVADILTAEHIPGENQIGLVVRDEPLLASGEVFYIGQPVAVVVAEDARIAREAARAIEMDIEELPGVFDARDAHAKGELLAPPRTFSLGNVEETWPRCDVVVSGRAESGGQEHFYLETQNALAYPLENGKLKVLSSTQSPGDVQRMIAGVLGLPMHRIEAEAPRLGGGFGGKEFQAVPWAAMAALAAFRLRKPVRIALRRDEDFRMTGKRHPYSSDFRIGLTRDGRNLAYEVSFYQNAGAVTDLSLSILERTLLHATGAYFIPNVRATAFSCRTNLPPNTAFRGFGTPRPCSSWNRPFPKRRKRWGCPLSAYRKRTFSKQATNSPTA